MSDEIHVHSDVVRVTDANVIGNSRFNRIKAENQLRHLSVHFRTDGINAPGPREALLVTVLTGIHPTWLQISDCDEEPGPVDIDFQAISTDTHGGSDPSRAPQFDVFHMTEVERGHMTRLHLAMTNESSSQVHATVVLNKGQVTQMIAALLVLYGRLHED